MHTVHSPSEKGDIVAIDYKMLPCYGGNKLASVAIVSGCDMHC